MTQIPLSIEQTVAAQPKRSTATKLVVGLLAGFAVVCVYQNGHRRRGASRVAVSPLHLAYRVEMRVRKCTCVQTGSMIPRGPGDYGFGSSLFPSWQLL